MHNPQQAHYESMHDAYVAHYFDATSMAYRRRFLFEPLFRGVDLSGKIVAEIACGSGHNSLTLRAMYPGIKLEGFDLSAAACEDYRRLLGAPAHQVDLTLPANFDSRFDAAVVIGGLHHCVSDLPTTISNLASMLKPGGLLLLLEPNARFFLQTVRNIWYRKDRYFHAATERALDPAELARLAASQFTTERVFFTGGPAYFLIANSLVLRVPLRAKPMVAGTMFAVESAWNRLPGTRLFAAFGAVWNRQHDSAG
jgi:SAM-dependent methyltransferase